MEAEELLESLSALIVELESSSSSGGAGTKQVYRLGARATGLRRRAADAIKRTKGVDKRRNAVRLEALGVALREALRKGGASGMAKSEERKQLLETDSTSDARDTLSSLARSRDMLAAGLEQISEAHNVVDQDESALRGVESYHKRIDNAMKSARRLVRTVTKRDQRDKLLMSLSLYTFYLVVAYIVYKRLPLKFILKAIIATIYTSFSSSNTHSQEKQLRQTEELAEL